MKESNRKIIEQISQEMKQELVKDGSFMEMFNNIRNVLDKATNNAKKLGDDELFQDVVQFKLDYLNNVYELADTGEIEGTKEGINQLKKALQIDIKHINTFEKYWN